MPRLGVQTAHVTDGETEVWGEAGSLFPSSVSPTY